MKISVVIIHPHKSKLQSLSDELIKSKNITIQETFRSVNKGYKYITTNPVDVLILSDQLNNQSGYKFVIELMKKRPIPTLILAEHKDKEIDFPKALDYPIVDTVDCNITNNRISNYTKIVISVNILGKLTLEKFQNQINQINQNKDLKFNNQSLTRDKSLQKKSKDVKKSSRRPKRTSGPSTKSKRIVGEKKQFEYLVIFGASTGGPRMLVSLISKLPKDFPPVIIVQHMPRGFVSKYAIRMNRQSAMNVKEAEDGDKIMPGNVYVCPGGRHLKLKRYGAEITIKLTSGPKVNYVIPAVDVTLKSAVKIYGSKVIPVILTGMGSDGKEGCKKVKEKGGSVITLSERDSLVYGMNKSVVDAGLSDYQKNLDQIIPKLLEIIS